MIHTSEITGTLTGMEQKRCCSHRAGYWRALSLIVGLISLTGLGGLKTVYAENTGTTEPGSRVIHFPKDRSLGVLKVAMGNISSPYYVDWFYGEYEWEYFGDAIGDVTVSADKLLLLEIHKAGKKDLSSLAQLKPDDLYMLSILDTPNQTVNSDKDVMPYLRSLTGLRALALIDINLTDKGLGFIKDLEALKYLRFGSDTVTNRGLSHLKNLKSLEALVFNCPRITDTGLRYLSNCTSLNQLFLLSSKIRGPGLVHLAKLPKLEYLHFWCEKSNNTGLKYLKGVTNLKRLNFRSMPITDAGLAYLSEFTKLEDLDLYKTQVTNAGLVHLKSMSSLKKLNLWWTQITDKGMGYIRQLKTLEHLELPNIGITDKGLAQLANLSNLKHLRVGCCEISPITDAGVKHISKLHSLEELHIGGTGITDVGMAYISKLTHLRNLSIEYASPSLSNQGLDKLTSLTSLSKLALPYTASKMSISGLASLNALANLAELSVHKIVQDNSGLNIAGLTRLEKFGISPTTGIRDDDLECLEKLKRLKWVQVNWKNGAVSDAGMAHLAGLIAVERLAISGPNLTDDGLAYLTNMKGLNYLKVTGSFTDKGLRHLEKLRALQHMKIYSANNFSSVALQRLRDNLPNLRSFTAEQDRAIGTKRRQPTPRNNRAGLDCDKSQGKGRVIHFPKDRSLGTLKIQDAGIKRRIKTFHYWVDGANWYEQAEYLGEAQGDVVIPAGKRVGLFVNKAAGKDLSALARLKANDLYSLTLTGSVNDSCMDYVTNLTGLRSLGLAGKITNRGMRNIIKLKSLEQLSLSEKTGNAGLAQVAKLSSLKRLYFGQTKVTDKGLSQLAKLTNLEELALSGKHIGNHSLVHLAKLPSLRYLILRGANFSDAGMIHVSKCSSLKILNLMHLPITDAGLRQLSSLTELENLSLYNTDITNRGLVHLKSMPSLKKLDVGTRKYENPPVTNQGMIHLAKIKNLEYLNLPSYGITERGLSYISNLTKLKYLCVVGRSNSPLSDTALQHVSKLHSLEHLLISGTGFTDAGMAYLAKLTNLRELYLTADSITNEGLAKLKALKSLEKLSLACKKVTISGLSNLNALGNIVELIVRNVNQDNSGLDISGLTKLEQLTLTLKATRKGKELFRDAVRDEDLTCLAKLKNLKWFQIGYTRDSIITDAGTANLADLTNMERLSIDSAYLTDKTLAHLTNMKKLNYLTITGNFTDAGLRYLEGLKAIGLLKIYSANNFSPEALQRLKDNLPNLHSFTADQDRAIGAKRRQPTPRNNKAGLDCDKSQGKGRVIHFPKERSLGRVKVFDVHVKRQIKKFLSWDDGVDWYQAAEDFGEAQGDVFIPAGKKVGLIFNNNALEDFSPLLNLKPDDLYMLSNQLSLSNRPSVDKCMPYIAYLTGLKDLRLGRTKATSKGMKHITKLQSLERLVLPKGLTNKGFSYVAELESLKGLSFVENSISNSGLVRYLPKLAKLEELALNGGGDDGRPISDAGLVCLTKLPSLHFLSLKAGNFTDAGMAHVKKCSSLRILNLSFLPITGAGLRHLSGHTRLENLNLYDTEVADRGLDYLKSMPSLKKLDIGTRKHENPPVTDQGMVHLGKLEGLEYLYLPYGITDRGLAHVARLENLKYLRAGGSSKGPFTDVALQHVSKLQSLESLQIGSPGLTDSGMDDLAKLTNLRELTLFRVDSITNEGLAKLKTLESLERLSLTGKNITVSGLSCLNAFENISHLTVSHIKQDNSGLDISGLTKLEELWVNLDWTRKGNKLYYDPVRDEDLACLKDLKNLRHISFAGVTDSMVTDAGIAYLKDLPDMRSLYCGSPYLTDKSLSNLANMKKLTSLTVTGNFTDEGLKYLENLKALTHLKIYSANNFSPEALKRLKDNLPNLPYFTAEKDREIGKMLKSNPKPPTASRVAPLFAVKTLDGKEIKLADYRGKVVLLYFWGTWCKPCVAATPQLKEFYQEMKDTYSNDFEMISFSMDESEHKLRNYVKKNNLAWPQVRIGLSSKISSDYGVNDRAPVSFLIGPDGKMLLTPESECTNINPIIDEAFKAYSSRRK